jgi:hypothetical protein
VQSLTTHSKEQTNSYRKREVRPNFDLNAF